MVTASAIATMERLAPGRCAYAFGTGASARWVFDQPALTWRYMQTYLEQLKGLLAGETVEIDGRRCEMIHHPEMAVARPIDVPIIVSAFGPKGLGVARELADGVMNMFTPAEGFAERVQMVSGTVLDDGESVTSARAAAAIGPWHVVSYHAFHQSIPEAVDGMPGGAEWRAGIEADRPEGERHLAVWEGHVTHLVARDAPLIDASGDGIVGLSWVGSADEIAARVGEAAAGGVTDLMFTPAGPDLERELRCFAAAAID
jgi:5,10-methylenetetrahydromethanopterin reductase